MNRRKSISLLSPYFMERRFYLICGVMSLIVVDCLQLFIPRIVKLAIDDLTAYRIGSAELVRYALSIVLIAILIGFFRYIWRRCLIGTSRRVEEGLRNRFFSHIQTLSSDYFSDTKTGVLMAHATNDIKQIRMAAGMGLVAITDAAVLGSAAILFMAYIHVELTLLVLIPMPIIVLGTRFFGKKMHRRYARVQQSFSAVTETVREIFTGIRTVKANNMETSLSRKFGAKSKEYIRENLRLVHITGTFMPMMLLLSNVSLVMVICFGGQRAIQLDITTGDFVAFISYLGLLTWPMMALGWVTNLLQRGRASLDRIQQVLSVSPSIRNTRRPVAHPSAKGDIRFEHVHFSYRPDMAPALVDISLHVPAGGSIGIVGPPGSGKTTLLNLIPRIYDVQEGCIRLDARDIRNLRLEHLRAAFSFVPQEPFLFDGSILENITLGEEAISPEKLDLVIRGAALKSLTASLPQGLETIVGEKGVLLSGGQRQRIALARALLHHAPVLLLDDPISQVDTRTGRHILRTIRQASKEKTVFISSHRMSAVAALDRVVALQDGKLVEYGTHEQLLSQNGYYARMYRMQHMEDEHHER